MQKVIIYRNIKSQLVDRVDIRIPQDITQEKLDQLVHDFNNDQNATRSVEIIDIEDSVYEAFKFLLGMDDYAVQYKIKSLYNKLDEVRDELESIGDDISNTIYMVANNLGELKEFMETEKQ